MNTTTLGELRYQSWREFVIGEIRRRGITQKDFARLSGVSPAMVSKWLSGWSWVPQISTLERMAENLGYDKQELMQLAGWSVFGIHQLHPAIAPPEWRQLTEEEQNQILWFARQPPEFRRLFIRNLKELREEEE